MNQQIDSAAFSVSATCKLSLKEVDDKVLTLCCLRTLHDKSKCCNNIPSLRVSIKSQGSSSPVATTCNFTMINSPPDAKKTVKVWLDFLETTIIEKFGLTKLVIVGDGKTYGVIGEIIADYPEQYSWVLRYLGEFHRNSVYMRCITKLYGGGGLETLASSTFSGITLHKVLKVTHYRKALGFLLNVQDAVIMMQVIIL